MDEARNKSIVRALLVTRLLGVAEKTASESTKALIDLRAASSTRRDPALTEACEAVTKTMTRLQIMLSRSAGAADEEEFDKVCGAVNSLTTTVRIATEQALDEAEAADVETTSLLVTTNGEAQDRVGLPRSGCTFALPRLVEDGVVIVVDGIPRVYDRTAADEYWVPLGSDTCRHCHVLSGEQARLITERLHESADGQYCVTVDHVLCRVDKRGVPRPLPGDLKGTALVRLADTLLAVGDDGALHTLDLSGNGRWEMLYDMLPISCVAIVRDRIVVVLSDGRAVETRIDGDLSCINQFTPWTELPDTEGLCIESVGNRAPPGLTLSHPDGRVMKVCGAGDIRLNSGEDLIVIPGTPADGFFSLDVQSGPGAGCDALEHFDYRLFSRPAKKKDVTNAWKFVKAPKGYYVYNDFVGNSWLGYDVLNDAVVIEPEDSPCRIAWTLCPEPKDGGSW